jgi:hypothetical protein
LKNFQIYTIAALHTTADGMTAFDNFSNCHLFLENGEKIILKNSEKNYTGHLNTAGPNLLNEHKPT